MAALVAAGVRDVVLSPGSRSAPLALALAAAETRGDIRLHVRIDERSAGFLAVGMGRAGGIPAAVVCTSGTAVANLLPAVVEARYGGVPMVVLTADRPPEARGRGASQTIDQTDIFGTFPVTARDLPVPDDTDWPIELIGDSVAAANRTRGPVHLNLPFRSPLVAAGIMGTGPVDRATLTPPDPTADGPDLGPVPPRGAILAGDLDVWDDTTRSELLRLADTLGWPVVAEASSGLLGAPGVVPGGTAVLADRAARTDLAADLVMSVGPFGLDRGVLAWVRETPRHVAVRMRPRTDPPDPLATAELILDALPSAHVPAIDPSWVAAWRERSQPVQHDWDLSGVAAQVWSSLSEQDLLLVAASSSIRALAAAARGPGPHVIANRGANGIDGLVSTAWGAADAWQRGRTVALLGDLALLHDTNGLLVPDAESRPDLTLVVADNNGGGIFSTLEQGDPQYADTFERIFGTPHDRDLVELLTAHRIPTVRAEDVDALAQALSDTSGGTKAVVVPELPRAIRQPPWAQ